MVLVSSCELNFDDYPIDERNKFIGQFEMEEYSEASGSIYLYDIEIVKSRTNSDHVYITNLYETDLDIFAEVSYDQFYIPLQRIDDFEIEGRGTWFSSDEISISYTIREIQRGPDFVDFLSGQAWRY